MGQGQAITAGVTLFAEMQPGRARARQRESPFSTIREANTMIPHVILHMGISLDGRIDRGFLPNSPYYELIPSFHADLDLTGTGTMLAAPVSEDPAAEYGEAYEKWISMPARPRLAIVDSRGLIRNWNVLKKQAWWSGLLALCSKATPQEYLDFLQEAGIDYVVAGEGKVDLRA